MWSLQTWLHCFNPRPRMGGDPLGLYFLHHFVQVSIHAPAWGATQHPADKRRIIRGFNPRPRMGGDQAYSTLTASERVSIHAPAWGATDQIPRPQSNSASFNPRPRMGGDSTIGCPDIGSYTLFQSTPPHGGRRADGVMEKANGQFQSTPPHGGRRHLSPLRYYSASCFNPRPRMGGDGAQFR